MSNHMFQVGDRVVARKTRNNTLDIVFDGEMGTIRDIRSFGILVVHLDRKIYGEDMWWLSSKGLFPVDPVQQQERERQLQDQQQRQAHADRYL